MSTNIIVFPLKLFKLTHSNMKRNGFLANYAFCSIVVLRCFCHDLTYGLLIWIVPFFKVCTIYLYLLRFRLYSFINFRNGGAFPDPTEFRRLMKPYCPNRATACNRHDLYRTANGSCNNLHNPSWGASLTTQARLMPPSYGDSE